MSNRDKILKQLQESSINYKESDTSIIVPALYFESVNPENEEYKKAKYVELLFTKRGKYIGEKIIK